jgi:hypothetical protein
VRRSTLLPGLALTLVLANAAWYLWPRLQPPPVAPAPEPGVERLVLLSELPPVETSGAAPPGFTSEQLPPLPALQVLRLQPRCWWLGPLVPGLQAALEALPGAVEIRRRPTGEGAEYWVYVPLRNSVMPVEAARARATELGIDNYLVQGGDLAGSLSFGYFRVDATARAVYEARSAQGFPVQVLSRERVRERDWLLLTPALRESMRWQRLDQPPKPWHELRLEPTACPAGYGDQAAPVAADQLQGQEPADPR